MGDELEILGSCACLNEPGGGRRSRGRARVDFVIPAPRSIAFGVRQRGTADLARRRRRRKSALLQIKWTPVGCTGHPLGCSRVETGAMIAIAWSRSRRALDRPPRPSRSTPASVDRRVSAQPMPSTTACLRPGAASSRARDAGVDVDEADDWPMTGRQAAYLVGPQPLPFFEEIAISAPAGRAAVQLLGERVGVLTTAPVSWLPRPSGRTGDSVCPGGAPPFVRDRERVVAAALPAPPIDPARAPAAGSRELRAAGRRACRSRARPPGSS